MASAIKYDVKILVRTMYQEQQSNPSSSDYMFAYMITIENHCDFTIQLLSRKWMIADSNGDHREVEGEGVVGQQPILQPGQVHQYVSGCNFKTEMGKMTGFYTFERLMDGTRFNIGIPEFHMIAPYRLN